MIFNKLAKVWQLLQKPGRFLLIIVLVIGIFFRFADLESKVFWHDEALTMSRISGYTIQEINEAIFNGKLTNVKELRKYQQKKSESKVLDIVDVLATDNPQHPPVYYLLLGLWSKIFGQSISSLRSLSALFSVLVLPCIYLLWKELRQLPFVGWVSMVIIATSPFHVLYAQEAREYSLWTLSILISSIALLRAIKLRNTKNWLVYAVISLIGLYIYPFSIFVSVGHGIYIFTREKFRFTKTSNFFLLAFSFAFTGFMPWLLLMVNQYSETGSRWTEKPISHISLIKHWQAHIYKAFFLQLKPNNFDDLLQYTFMVLLLFVISCSFYLLIRQTKRDVWLLMIILSSVVFLPLAGADILFGGMRSITSRYLMPSYLGIQLSLAFGLAYYLNSSKFIIKKIAQILFIAIICIQISSCMINFQKNVSWAKCYPDVAKIINNSDNSLLISNSHGMNLGNILALSHLLNDNISLILLDGRNRSHSYQSIPKIPRDFDNIFFLSVSEQFKKKIEQQYNIQLEKIYDYHLQLELF